MTLLLEYSRNPQVSFALARFIVTYISIARQRLGKHITAKRTHAIEGRPLLLGNGPVNKPP
jgi:hypothetical protein